LLSKRRLPVIEDGYGSATFATKEDITAAGLFRREGVIVGHAHGHTLRAPRGKHFLFIGPSGSGKSVLIRKTLATYPESVICLAPKGTLQTDTARIRERYGPVYSFDPVHGGHHLNPFDLMPWGSGQEVSMIQRMVSHLTYTEADTRSDAGLYYLAESQESFWATIPYVHYSGVDEASLGGLRRFYSCSGAEIRTRIKSMLAFGQPSPHSVIHDWAEQMMGKPIDLLDKIWSASRRWLAPWVDPTLAWNMHDTTIDLNAFQQQPRPATLYLNIMVHDLQGRLRSTTRLLLDLISLFLCDRDEHAFRHDVLWVLDDMGELRYLEMVDRLHTYLRGYGHFLLGGVQSFKQLWQWYGRESAIFNNATTWVMFRPMDADEGETIAKHLGMMTVMEPVERMTRTARGGSRSVGLQSHARQLMTSQEIRSIRDDQLIISVGGHPPILGERGPMEIAA
jgi:type IV secretory pathway TraG/TraD family ATPase VirD4